MKMKYNCQFALWKIFDEPCWLKGTKEVINTYVRRTCLHDRGRKAAAKFRLVDEVRCRLELGGAAENHATTVKNIKRKVSRLMICLLTQYVKNTCGKNIKSMK